MSHPAPNNTAHNPPVPPLEDLGEDALRRAHASAVALIDANQDLTDRHQGAAAARGIFALIRIASEIRRGTAADRSSPPTAPRHIPPPPADPGLHRAPIAEPHRAAPTPTAPSAPPRQPPAAPHAPAPSSAAPAPSPRAVAAAAGQPRSATQPPERPSLPASLPPASSFPAADLDPMSAIRIQLEALRQNNHPEPHSGVATLYAFTTEGHNEPVPVPWARFAADFDKRLRDHLLGFTSARIHPLSYVPRQGNDHSRATYRVELDHPGRAASALVFHLIQLPVVGSRPTWFVNRIQVLDSG